MKKINVRFEKENDDETPDVLAKKLYTALNDAHVL